MTTSNTPLLRKDYNRHYLFTVQPDGKLAAAIRSTLSVINPTDIEQPYRSQMEFEQQEAPASISVVINTAGTQCVKQGACSPSTSRPRIVDFFSDEVVLPPKGECLVIWEYTVPAQTEGGDLISFGRATERACVEVEFQTPANFTAITEGIPQANECDGKAWKFNRTLQSGECLSVRWWPTEAL